MTFASVSRNISVSAFLSERLKIDQSSVCLTEWVLLILLNSPVYRRRAPPLLCVLLLLLLFRWPPGGHICFTCSYLVSLTVCKDIKGPVLSVVVLTKLRRRRKQTDFHVEHCDITADVNVMSFLFLKFLPLTWALVTMVTDGFTDDRATVVLTWRLTSVPTMQHGSPEENDDENILE